MRSGHLSAYRKLISSNYYSPASSFASLAEMNSIKADDLSLKQQYDDVIKALNGLQSNAAVLKQLKPQKKCQSLNIPLTYKYLDRCGIDIDKLNGKAIHVTGTKGKGSTCALTESILRAHGYKTGFYSSPHLFSVTERIRIDGKPISYELFIKYFWEVYLKLYNNKEDEYDMPSYFKFLTLMAFKVFIGENVDVAVVEVGIGGEYDCTNTLRKTSVVGVTSLGYDHLSVLGNTIEEIGWNKGGIMKEGCAAFTCCDLPPPALRVLHQRAIEKKCKLYVIDRKVDLAHLKCSNKLLELNGSLAVQLSHAWMSINTNGSLSHKNIYLNNNISLDDKTREGLENYNWPGRFQVVPGGRITVYLDGAHTDESISLCVDWFKQVAPKSGKKILLFNLTGSRNSQTFLSCLADCGFDLACFCPNVLNNEPLNDNIKVADSDCKMMTVCAQNAQIWYEITNRESKIFSSIAEAMSFLSSLDGEEALHLLVTGSLHLVGNVTCYMFPDLWHNS